MLRRLTFAVVFLGLSLSLGGCPSFGSREPQSLPPRLAVFIGMDISGSFVQGKYFDDSIDFLAVYLYAHLNGYGGLEVPHSLFVGSIGGDKPDEPKTFFPIQTFQNHSVDEIRAKLHEIFPKTKINPFTDFNAFFKQVENTVKNKKLVLKPISVMMMSDGMPDVPGAKGDEKFRKMDVSPLEALSRNVTLRLIYTDAVTGKLWQTKVPRKRVKIWTQDAAVVADWKNPKIFSPEKDFALQSEFFSWLKDNIDFAARTQRVD